MAVNETWLAQTTEPPLDPDLPIIDSHHHLWDRPSQRPTESYVGENYLQDASAGHRIVGSVYVECNSMYRMDSPVALRPVGETDYVNALAKRLGASQPVRLCSAIVGYADLTLGDAVDEVLLAHLATAPARFRGIRQTTAWDADPQLHYKHLTIAPRQLLATSFRRGIARLAARDLSFDVWAFHPQLPEVFDLARAFPDLTVVVDHLGGPLGIGRYANERAEALTHWRRYIRALASCPNIYMKLGGMAMHCIGLDFKASPKPPDSDTLIAGTQDFYSHAIDCFGPSRCMFESNFPVDKESVPASVLWNSFKKIAARYSAAERGELFAGTAARVYRIQHVLDDLA